MVERDHDFIGLPAIYRGVLRPGKVDALAIMLDGLAARRDATLRSLPEGVDPRSLAEVELEHQMRRLVVTFMAASEQSEVDQAEVAVCALVNVLGSILMAGCSSPADANERVRKLRNRLMMFAEDEMAREPGA